MAPEAALSRRARRCARRSRAGPHAVGRVIARPFDGRAGRLRAHRSAAATSRSRRRRAATSSALREAGVPRSTASARRRRSSTASASARSTRARATREAIASVERLIGALEAGAGVRQPDRDRPGLRSPQGRRRLPRGAARDRRRAWPAGCRALRGGGPAGHHRRPRLRPDRLRTPTTRASTRRCSLAFAGDGGRRHDGPLADVGASVLDWLTDAAAALPGRSFIGRCLSCPRSRRSAASSSRRGRSDGSASIEVLDPRWCAPLAPAELERRARRAARAGASPPRQVPRLGARATRSTC